MILLSETLDVDGPNDLKPFHYKHWFYFAAVLKFLLQRDFQWHVLTAEDIVFVGLI